MIPGNIPLLHGHSIPRLGIGTWPLVGDAAHEMVELALQVGYRLIDTSHKYGNEVPVGAAIRESGIPRDEIFVTSKFNKEDHSVDGVQRAYDESLRRTGLDHLDLFLIHWPVPWLDGYVQAWKGLVKLVDDGRVTAIGVSNFKPGHLERIIAATGRVPDVNQIQLSVDLTRDEARDAHRRWGIVTEAWSPLGRGGPLLTDPVVAGIAQRHQRTAAQVLLRWHIQHGIVPIPRADNLAQLRENAQIFDFELDRGDMAALAEFDLGEAAARDSDSRQNGH
jgi:2,5-diketo-D-gluconate reductase A